MSRIFLTGDIHGDPRKFNSSSFPVGKELTKDDYVIICGDFGLVWSFTGETAYEKNWLDWLDNKPWTTLFCEGNHENFERLYNYPVEEWNGGKVHKIRPSVIHLMRGQMFNLDGVKVFSFGGAASHDIQDGILDPDNEDDCLKIYQWRKDYSKCFRILNVSWWKEEMPSEEEYEEGLETIKHNKNKADIIISHCCPTSTQTLLGGGLYKPDILTEYLEDVRARLTYDKWFFGHYHVDKTVNEKDICFVA